MAGSEKEMNCVEPIRNLKQLELHYKELRKVDHNQVDQSQSQPKPKPKPKQQELQKNDDDRKLLQQQAQYKPKLPQRRKCATLEKANSATDEANLHANIDNSAGAVMDARISGVGEEGGKALDLGVKGAEGEVMRGNGGGCEVGLERKKLLVQLGAGNPSVRVGGQSKGQKGFNHCSVQLANNPSRACRVCGREFPSGRALGGHMRVHGAFLAADTTDHMEQETHQQKLEQQLHLGSDPTHCEVTQIHEEREAARSFRSSSSSEMNSAGFHQHHPLIKHGISLNQSIKLHEEPAQEEEEEEEEVQENRMVKLSYFECTSGFALMGKTEDELLGDGDGDGDGAVSSAFFTGKRNPALYELRRNPKPNQRFIRDQELSLANPIWPANYHANHMASSSAGARRSLSPSPERARPCSECGKVFSSLKALFGHMRCHPEREWRGIQRPESSLELDRTARLITRRPPSAELSNAEDDNNCEGAGNDAEKRGIRQQEASFKMALQEETEAEAAEKPSSMTQKGGMASAIEPKGDVEMQTEQGGGRKQGVLNKAECIIKRHKAKRATDIALLREVTDDWTPTWPTGKRSKRRRTAQSQHEPALTSETTSNELRLDQKRPQLKDQEDLDMANCLVLLSSAGKNMQEVDRMCMESTEESAFSHPGRKQRFLPKGDYSERALGDDGEAEDRDHDHNDDVRGDVDDEAENNVAALADDEAEIHGRTAPSATTGVKYQCSTCKKCFNSHQALGGHRASHRKMKGCFARTKNLAEEEHESGEENITEEDFLSSEHIKWQLMRHGVVPSQHEEERTTVSINPPSKPSKKKLKGHECSICHRIFPSGQALGGHKRCHWTGERITADTASVASSNNNSSNKQTFSLQERAEWRGGNNSTEPKKTVNEDVIDLNLPAPLDEDDEFGFDMMQEALVYDRWNQQWNTGVVAQIPQVCAMQPL